MKRIILVLLVISVSVFASGDNNSSLVSVPIYSITDNVASNYFFSLIFYVLLFVIPSKIALQILWDYASHRKS